MHGLQIPLTGALLGSFATFGLVYAQRGQGNGGSGTLTGADLAEIQQLYSRYSQGTDFGTLHIDRTRKHETALGSLMRESASRSATRIKDPDGWSRSAVGNCRRFVDASGKHGMR